MHRTIPGLLALSLLVACGDKDDDTTSDGGSAGSRIDTILALDGDATAGAEVFSANCTGCHGVDGNSGSAPQLSDEVPSLSDSELLTIVLEGKDNMPAINLDDQEAADLLAHLRATY